MQTAHRCLAFAQRVCCRFNHRIQWQIVDLIQRLHQTLLDLRQTAAHRWDDLVATEFTDTGNRRCFRVEVHIHIQRTGYQVAGFQRPAQTAFHQLGDMSRDILIFTNLIKQTLWFNADQYRNAVIIIQHLLKARNEERHLPNRTETNAAELNRRPRLQAANGVFKEHQEVNVIGIERILNAFLIVKETESGVLCDRLP